MTIVNQSALVAYSAAQMYQLVNNYERYPEFLPGCVGSRTLTKSAVQLTGELEISKAVFDKSSLPVIQWWRINLLRCNWSMAHSNFYKANGGLLN